MSISSITPPPLSANPPPQMPGDHAHSPSQKDKTPKAHKIAASRILSLCTGNGFTPKDFGFRQFQSQQISLTMSVTLTPKVNTTTRQEKGRQTNFQHIGIGDGDNMHDFQAYDIYDSPADLLADLQGIEQSFRHDQKLLSHILRDVMKRPNQGFGGPLDVIELKTLEKNMACYAPCPTCHGQTQIACQKCDGQGAIACIRCNGKCKITCAVCQGHKTIRGPHAGAGAGASDGNGDGDAPPCPRCTGAGEVDCEFCQGSGQNKCDRCDGAGQRGCHDCHGDGVHTHISRAQVTLESLQHIDISPDIPPAIADHITQAIPQLLSQKIARLKEVKTGKNDQGLPVIIYRLIMPMVQFQMVVHRLKKTFPVTMIGFQPIFIQCPPLLDLRLSGLIEKITNATQKTKGSAVLKTLRQIGQFKIFRQAMAQNAKSGIQATSDILAKNYAPLLNKDNAHHIALQTHLLLQSASILPGFQAMIATAILITGLFGAYFISPAQDWTTHVIKNMMTTHLVPLPAASAFLTPQNLENISQATSYWGMAVIGLGLTYICNKWFTNLFFKLKIGRLLPGNFANLILQKTQSRRVIPLILTALSFAIITILAGLSHL